MNASDATRSDRRIQIVKGFYCSGDGYVGRPDNWARICKEHQEEFPHIQNCIPGSFNIRIIDPCSGYIPPDEQIYLDLKQDNEGKPHPYISPRTRVVSINDRCVLCWIYRGGHGKSILELLSCLELKALLKLSPGASVSVKIEVVDEGTPGMPRRPSKGTVGPSQQD